MYSTTACIYSQINQAPTWARADSIHTHTHKHKYIKVNVQRKQTLAETNKVKHNIAYCCGSDAENIMTHICLHTMYIVYTYLSGVKLPCSCCKDTRERGGTVGALGEVGVEGSSMDLTCTGVCSWLLV